MKIPYKYCVENRQGIRIQGASVFFVPYIAGATTSTVCNINNAVTFYMDENGSSPATSIESDANGEVYVYLDPGEYSVCVRKGNSHYTEPYICIESKDEGSNLVEQTFDQEIEVNPEFKHTINHGLGSVDLDVLVCDAEGKPVYPSCEIFDENTICLTYGQDCPASTHTVKLTTFQNQPSEDSDMGDSTLINSLIDHNKYLVDCLKEALQNQAGGPPVKLLLNGEPIENYQDTENCFNILFSNSMFAGAPLQDSENGPVLPKIKVNGSEAVYDPQTHCLNFSINLPDIQDGGSSMISTENGVTTIGPLISCDNQVIDASIGELQTCANIPECGYTGDKICENVSVDTPSGTESQFAVGFSAGALDGMFILTQSGPGGFMNVGTPTVSATVVEVPVELSSNAKVGYNVLVDKTNLPTVDGCTSPISGFIEINGLTGDVDGSQITKAVGGTVVNETNLSVIQGNVYETINNLPSAWRDEVPATLFNGDPSNLVGSTETGEVQVFDGSTQNVVFRFEVCRYLPAVGYRSLDGTWVSGIDSDGNAINQSDFQTLT